MRSTSPGAPVRQGERWPIFELIELYDLTANGGDDPALDLLLVDFGIESGAGREGAYEFTMGQIKVLEQLLEDAGQVQNARRGPGFGRTDRGRPGPGHRTRWVPVRPDKP